MSEMVERVARAMASAGCVEWDELPRCEADGRKWGHLSELTRDDYRGEARAAIAEMRGPIVAIIEARVALYEKKAAARDPLAPADCNGYERALHCADAITWLRSEMDSMIDAALSEQP